MKGWIYLISNVGFTMTKIGRSQDDPVVITRKMDAAGGSPFPYIVEYQLFLSESFLLLQNLRRSLWTRDISIISGWCSLSVSECITIIREEIARYVIDRFRMTIQKGEDRADVQTMLKILDTTLLISENMYYERNSIKEVRAIALVTAEIMRSDDWKSEGSWVNRVTQNNHIFAINN